MAQLLVLNGPNLNMLGTREPNLYGHITLAQLEAGLIQWGGANGHEVECFQSNSECALIEKIHGCASFGPAPKEGIVINAGAFTHTSLALADALGSLDVPYIEVHISNVHARESFRHHSYIAAKAIGIIAGLGSKGYEYALAHLAQIVGQNSLNKDKLP